MNYTERFFEFPIRIYDRFATEKAMEAEKKDDIPMDGDWIAGKVKIPYEQITSWSDYFDSSQGVDGVRKDGFQYTLVWTQDEGPFISTWEKKKFEEKLNGYVTVYEESMKEHFAWHINKINEMKNNEL